MASLRRLSTAAFASSKAAFGFDRRSLEASPEMPRFEASEALAGEQEGEAAPPFTKEREAAPAARAPDLDLFSIREEQGLSQRPPRNKPKKLFLLLGLVAALTLLPSFLPDGPDLAELEAFTLPTRPPPIPLPAPPSLEKASEEKASEEKASALQENRPLSESP